MPNVLANLAEASPQALEMIANVLELRASIPRSNRTCCGPTCSLPSECKRLSSESSDLPRPAVSEHCIEDREELAHGGDDRDFVRTARGHEAASSSQFFFFF